MTRLPTTFDAWADLLREGTPIQEMLELPFELDGEKRELLAYIFEELDAGAPIVRLVGAAGTGKTTALNIVLKILNACSSSYTLAAPTHMALSRAKEATGITDGMTVTLAMKGGEVTVTLP